MARSRKQKIFLVKVRRFFRDRFNLHMDSASQDEVQDNINRGVEFRGTNLWVLIFATFIASLGLNVNSAAVIIGAMLISPLMGPIIGIGFSLGINDFELMKRSVRNFLLMVLIAILASTIYFFLSPLSDARSELLARTEPTTYDVLIAFFGGLAGILAQSRKDRTSTVIPGVAIATALMPPLCTAGYGLATGQFTYFIGAFYLFLINTVFIAFATFFMVRLLNYQKKVFLDKKREKRVKQYMAAILVVTLVPSVIVAYQLVQRSVFENNVDRFVSNVVRFEKSEVIDCKKTYNGRKGSQVELVLVGDLVSADAIENIQAQMPLYNLGNVTLTVRQPSATDPIDLSFLQKNYAELVVEKNRQIVELQHALSHYETDTLASADISRELSALMPGIADVALSRSVRYDAKGAPQDTLLVCLLRSEKAFSNDQKETVINWLKIRTKVKDVALWAE